MKTRRRKVFETNSSSSHSIEYFEGPSWDTIIPDEDGVILLTGGQYGWEECQYNKAIDKANYCAVDFRNNEELTNMLIEVIQEYTGCKDVVIDLIEDGWHWSYIDHQSDGTAREYATSIDELKTLIFNKSCYIITDNDNHW